MNRLPETLFKFALAVGQHEAGHYIIGRRLGFRGGEIKVKMTGPNGEHDGSAATHLAASIARLREMRRFLENRTIVLFAGSLAEHLDSVGGIDLAAAELTLTQRNGVHDWKKVQHQVHFIRNITYAKDDINDVALLNIRLKAIQDELHDRAIALVVEEQEIIRGLGGRIAQELEHAGLHNEVTLSEAMIEAIPDVKAWGEKLSTR